MAHTSFTINNKTHIAIRLDPQDAVAEWCRDKFPHGAVITACRLSFDLGAGELAVPGYEVTCGNCKRIHKS